MSNTINAYMDYKLKPTEYTDQVPYKMADPDGTRFALMATEKAKSLAKSLGLL